MAEVLDRPETLYDQDLLAWAEQQAEHLRAGRLDALDAAHLIEELDEMAASRRRELKRRLRILLMHLLKWEFQARRRSPSWARTMVEQRAEIDDLLEENPSLRREVEATARAAYPQAVRLAMTETGLPRTTFPPQLPYSPDDILSEEEKT